MIFLDLSFPICKNGTVHSYLLGSLEEALLLEPAWPKETQIYKTTKMAGMGVEDVCGELGLSENIVILNVIAL